MKEKEKEKKMWGNKFQGLKMDFLGRKARESRQVIIFKVHAGGSTPN